jgi:hypothetical protein
MSGLIVVLAVIAGLLFYRVVERRHKIVLFKALLAVVGVSALGVGLLLLKRLYDQRQEERLLASVTITFMSDSVTQEGSPKKSIPDRPWDRQGLRVAWFRICNQGTDTVLSVDFVPKTRRRAHSGEHNIVEWEGNAQGVLSPDDVIPPTSCVTIPFVAFSGTFDIDDTVFASARDVKTSRNR